MCQRLFILCLVLSVLFVPFMVRAQTLPPLPGEKPLTTKFFVQEPQIETETADVIDAAASVPAPSSPAAAEKPAAKVEEVATEKAPTVLNHIGALQTYVTSYEDTFLKIARANNLGFVELRAANPEIDPWLPGANRQIILPSRHIIPDARHEGIIINLPEMRLYHFPSDGGEARSFPIGVGREGLSTPVGLTHIRAKKEGPTWRPTKRMREEDPALPVSVGPGPDNPLGTHMLYLAWPEYGIHGTNKPYGIGRRVSSGCIRMYPEDIKALYPTVKVNEPVAVVNQPLKTAWIDGVLYLEAHPTIYQADYMETEGRLPDYILSNDELSIIFAALKNHDAAVDWNAVRQIIRERRGYPIEIARETPAAPDAVPDGRGG